MELLRRRFKAMGCPCEIQLHPERGVDVAAVLDAALAEVERLEQKYSRYRADSLATRINRSAGDPAGVEVDPETASLLDYAATCHAQSGGLFDITSGILRRAWRFDSGRLPARGEVEELLERVGWRRVRWERPRLVLPVEGMELDFGGYVKEYTADRVAELCRRRGARHGLVDLGGDLCVVGPHPDGSPWRVGVRDPRRPERSMASISLSRGAIATSGDYERCMVVDGRRYGHILDPRSGWPVEGGLVSVSVVAAHCLVAGSVSTVAMLKPEPAGVRWLEDAGLPHLRLHASGHLRGSLATPEAAAQWGRCCHLP